jgi:dethiobiotin synthetase
MKLLFVTGIGTGVGKTLVSAILTETLSADYWKPVQSGFDEGTDSETVKKLISKPEGRIFPEIYLLKAPVSPHAAAKKENISIKIKLLKVPKTKKTLIIEGAGGLMVPLNDHELMVDFIKKLNAEVILVVRHYLGSINHTLLSVKALEVMKIRVAGIIFNGRPDLM